MSATVQTSAAISIRKMQITFSAQTRRSDPSLLPQVRYRAGGVLLPPQEVVFVPGYCGHDPATMNCVMMPSSMQPSGKLKVRDPQAACGFAAAHAFLAAPDVSATRAQKGDSGRTDAPDE